MKKVNCNMHGEHVMRGSIGLIHLTILDGNFCGKKPRGRLRLAWIDDIL